MAKITVSYFRKVYNQFSEEKISMSRMVEMLNEESDRELTIEESIVFARNECIFNYCPTSEKCNLEGCQCDILSDTN